MDFSGKRSARFRIPAQVGMDPEMGAIVRARAARMGRTIEMQVLHFIETGIKADPEAAANEHLYNVLHSAAQRGAGQEVEMPLPAPPRTSGHAPARKNGTTGANGD